MSCTFFDFTVPEGMTATLRMFLRRSCGISARSLSLLKTVGSVTRGGREIHANEAITGGDVIRLTLPEEHNEIEPVEGELSILYEDDFLLIVNKPIGMPVHPTKNHQHDTLANLVADYQRKRGEDYTFRALNRLDKNTSGCVIIAKDRLTYGLVFGRIEKEYIAVCEGTITEEGTVDAPIALASDSKIRRCVSENGQRAVTHYRPILSGNHHTMLSLRLETGRTHQIRCHMSSIGHPLAGDDLYEGSTELRNCQALHCVSVSLPHPYKNERIFVKTEIPSDFYELLMA